MLADSRTRSKPRAGYAWRFMRMNRAGALAPGRAEEVGELLLKAESLTCERAGRLLFRDLSFAVAGGRAVQLLGGNGAGKTTLLRALAGLFNQYEGRILRTENFPADCIYAGHVAAASGALTARENLVYAVRMDSGRKAEAEAVRGALDAVGLSGHERAQVRSLSAGQKKRLVLARLLLADARLWVLDEPFASMDAAGRRLLESMMLRHREAGGGLVLSGHEPAPADDCLHIALADYRRCSS